jgi:hypothetical protein
MCDPCPPFPPPLRVANPVPIIPAASPHPLPRTSPTLSHHSQHPIGPFHPSPTCPSLLLFSPLPDLSLFNFLPIAPTVSPTCLLPSANSSSLPHTSPSPFPVRLSICSSSPTCLSLALSLHPPVPLSLLPRLSPCPYFPTCPSDPPSFLMCLPSLLSHLSHDTSSLSGSLSLLPHLSPSRDACPCTFAGPPFPLSPFPTCPHFTVSPTTQLFLFFPFLFFARSTSPTFLFFSSSNLQCTSIRMSGIHTVLYFLAML